MARVYTQKSSLEKCQKAGMRAVQAKKLPQNPYSFFLEGSKQASKTTEKSR